MALEFWVTIDGDLGKKGEELWSEIAIYHVNLTQLFDVAYIYGDTSEYVLRDIIYKATKYGLPLQLHT
jgi:hypothetical protein